MKNKLKPLKKSNITREINQAQLNFYLEYLVDIHEALEEKDYIKLSSLIRQHIPTMCEIFAREIINDFEIKNG